MNLSEHILSFATISLDKIKGIGLTNRIDTKYVADCNIVAQLLESIVGDYVIVAESTAHPIEHYRTTYFDTSDLDMYRLHRCGALPRHKVRVRNYRSSGDRFVEVKVKDNHKRTHKKRIATISDDLTLADAFISDNSGYVTSELRPSLVTEFRRLTLVDKNLTERITIDTDLRFFNPTKRTSADLSALAIIEIKHAATCAPGFARILSDHRLRPVHFSKYCTGLILTDPTLPQGRLKPRIHAVEQLLRNIEPSSE